MTSGRQRSLVCNHHIEVCTIYDPTVDEPAIALARMRQEHLMQLAQWVSNDKAYGPSHHMKFSFARRFFGDLEKLPILHINTAEHSFDVAAFFAMLVHHLLTLLAFVFASRSAVLRDFQVSQPLTLPQDAKQCTVQILQ